MGKALLNTTGREADAAAISWASLIGRWPLQAARWAAAGSSSAACSVPSRGPSELEAIPCSSSRASPTGERRCTIANTRTTSSWSSPRYERPVGRDLGLSVYLAPVGEPAVGPVAFPHRPSAADDPLAPISHHWQDGTHITFGVVKAGVFTRAVKLEGSWFNGREPDDHRTDFDYTGSKLDSYSVRLTANPGRRWSASAWYTYLKSPEELHP